MTDVNPVDDPVKQTTPIWWLESGVLKGVIAAVITLAGLVASAFGADEALFGAQAAKTVDPLLTLANFGSLLYIAWQRAKKPTPPVTLSKPAGVPQ